MKKFFGISLIVMFILAIMVVPALGQGLRVIDLPDFSEETDLDCTCFTNDMILDAVFVNSLGLSMANYTRWSVVSDNAFQNAHGITTVNLPSGNGNVLETNIDVTALTKASSFDLNGSMIVVGGLGLGSILREGRNNCCKEYYTRWSVVSDNAFQNAVGITTVNLPSGDYNVMQTNIGIEVAPTVAASIHN